MITGNIEKYLCRLSLIFISYLLLGSCVVSNDLFGIVLILIFILSLFIIKKYLTSDEEV